jgi:hypothetical protein
LCRPLRLAVGRHEFVDSVGILQSFRVRRGGNSAFSCNSFTESVAEILTMSTVRLIVSTRWRMVQRMLPFCRGAIAAGRRNGENL